MGKLNAPREIPYDFRLFAADGWVWLYDDSERTYLCSATPCVFAEPVYALSDEAEDGGYPEPDYFGESTVQRAKGAKLELDIPWDEPAEDAWNTAREYACGSCYSLGD